MTCFNLQSSITQEHSDIDRFNYLHSLLKGAAAEAISGLSLIATDYAEVIATLKKRFRNKQQTINKHMDTHHFLCMNLSLPCEILKSFVSSTTRLRDTPEAKGPWQYRRNSMEPFYNETTTARALCDHQ